jgi:hypothetical protein
LQTPPVKPPGDDDPSSLLQIGGPLTKQVTGPLRVTLGYDASRAYEPYFAGPSGR